jgi:hypothetical protein
MVMRSPARPPVVVGRQEFLPAAFGNDDVHVAELVAPLDAGLVRPLGAVAVRENADDRIRFLVRLGTWQACSSGRR